MKEIKNFRENRHKKRNSKRGSLNLQLNDIVLVKRNNLSKSLPLYGTLLYKITRVNDYTVEILRLIDNVLQIQHKSRIKKVLSADSQDFNIPPKILQQLGLAIIAPNSVDLDSQIPKIRVKERVQTRSQTNKDEGNLIEEEDSSDSSEDELIVLEDNKAKKRVRFNV